MKNPAVEIAVAGAASKAGVPGVTDLEVLDRAAVGLAVLGPMAGAVRVREVHRVPAVQEVLAANVAEARDVRRGRVAVMIAAEAAEAAAGSGKVFAKNAANFLRCRRSRLILFRRKKA